MLSITKKTLAGIPCFEIVEPETVPQAEILLYHGWGSHAQKQCFRGRLLAGFGHRVIVPEISGHGERGSLDYEAAESVVDFLQVLAQSVRECVALAAEALTPGRSHFLVGHSLGGMIVLGAAAGLQETLNGVAAMNSSANWADTQAMMQGVYGDEARVQALLAGEAASEARAALAGCDPALWQAQGMTVPVLLTNGALDQTLPASLNAAFCAAYGGSNVRQMVFPEAGHVVTDGMLAEVVAFIEKHQ